MSTTTGGTNATDSLSPVLTFLPGFDSGMAAADVATMQEAILDDLNVAHPMVGGDSFSYNGWLYVPNRGRLQMLPGDVVMIDSTGWPILVSANAIAYGPWTVG